MNVHEFLISLFVLNLQLWTSDNKDEEEPTGAN